MSEEQARVWHSERKSQGVKEYYIVIVDEGMPLSFTITYDSAKKVVSSNIYTPYEYNYTVHDDCDHDGSGYCALEDPYSWVSQELEEAARHHNAVVAVKALEEQVRQQQIAARLAEEADQLRLWQQTKAKASLSKRDNLILEQLSIWAWHRHKKFVETGTGSWQLVAMSTEEWEAMRDWLEDQEEDDYDGGE